MSPDITIIHLHLHFTSLEAEEWYEEQVLNKIGIYIYIHGIFTYIWLIFMIHVGEYTSPMDSMGYIA